MMHMVKYLHRRKMEVEAVKIYAKVLKRIIEFYIRRHPYITAALLIWSAGSLYIGATSSWKLCTGMILAAVLLILLLRWMWVFFNDFGSKKAKASRKLQKIRNREILLDYIEKGIR